MISTLTLRQLKTALEQAKQEKNELFVEAASPERWSEVRKDERYAAFWERLETQAALLSGSPAIAPLFSDFILFGETGDRKTYEEKQNHLFSGLHVFSMLAMTDDRPEWNKGLENAIWSICNEYTWVLPAHVGLYVNEYPHGIWEEPLPPRETVDLFSAMAGFVLAEIIHRQSSRLHPWVVARAKAEIERRIFQVYFHDPVPQNWELKTNNWPAVCASSIGAAAIYLIEDSEKLAGMLWRVIGVLRQYLSGFDEQGATSEGPHYWQFGFSQLVCFAELLKERTGGRIMLLTEPKIEHIAQFPYYCLLTDGKVINFSDASHEIQLHTGFIQRLRDYFPSVALLPEEYQLKVIPANWTEASRLMLWSPPVQHSEAGGVPAERVQERMFAGNQWFISKVRQADGRVAAFAAKGGHNEEPHNHNDLGHFILHIDGTTVLADIGIGVYTKQYFQPEYRYETIHAGSHGHSVPIIEGCRQGFGRTYRTELLHSEITENKARFVLDLTQAYECSTLQRLTREFVWHRPEHEGVQLVLTDIAEFHESPAVYQEVFICGVEPRQLGPGRIALGEAEMIFEEGEWEIEVQEQWTVSHRGDRNMFHRLILTRQRSSLSMECRFRFQLTY
ncbi:heparinase II/III family protein [Paenibacillus silvisoli]|uniref:heparinase II/III family protein n=1 Tax=Paenibacillus silvisoli TaxID=3110539 RepID=UPI0028065C62|nr:heparinase II/III family protein [Paenibacillus silvisoli]